MGDGRKENCVVRNLLEKNAESMGERVFFHWGDLKRTFRDMNERASRMANGFLDLGARKGDHALIFMPNMPAYMDVWFGLAKMGAVEIPKVPAS